MTFDDDILLECCGNKVHNKCLKDWKSVKKGKLTCPFDREPLSIVTTTVNTPMNASVRVNQFDVLFVKTWKCSITTEHLKELLTIKFVDGVLKVFEPNGNAIELSNEIESSEKIEFI